MSVRDAITPEQRERIGTRRVIVSVSGGKDSVALWLWARRSGLDPVAVYADTHWELEANEGQKDGPHYEHLALLESRIGPLHRCAQGYTFEERVALNRSFPSRVRKWCTPELKLEPFAAWLDAYRERTGEDVVVLVGVRREESAKRADPVETPEWEWHSIYDCEMWRPLLAWTLADVMAEHHRAAIPLHPLYHRGAERVGCWPCVNASKAELRLLAETSPERVARIRAMEAEIGATMFTFDRRAEKKRLIKSGTPKEAAGPSVVPAPIDDVLAWARTTRGGQQLALLAPPSGCMRWGSCDAPVRDNEGAA